MKPCILTPPKYKYICRIYSFGSKFLGVKLQDLLLDRKFQHLLVTGYIFQAAEDIIWGIYTPISTAIASEI